MTDIPEAAAKALVWLLFAVHAGLALWAVAGIVELFTANPPWPRISNARFPVWMLAAQWSAVLIAAVLYMAGLFLHWPGTPVALACIYLVMAAVCAVQHVSGMIVHDGHWWLMGLEYAVYAAILAALFGSPAVRSHFALHGAGMS